MGLGVGTIMVDTSTLATTTSTLENRCSRGVAREVAAKSARMTVESWNFIAADFVMSWVIRMIGC